MVMAKGVEIFGRPEFEAALPTSKETGKTLWSYVGFDKGEHVYLVQPFARMPFGVLVRSSIGENGTSAGCGEDSIRSNIVRIISDEEYQIHGGKSQRWVTRVKGWGDRLTDVLRRLANQIRWCLPCPHCGETLVPFTSKAKGSPIKGQGFVRCCSRQCYNADTNRSQFFAVTDDEGKEPIAPPDNFGKPSTAPQPAKPANAPAPFEQCPNCHKMALGVSRFNAAEMYCFPNAGGCRFKCPAYQVPKLGEPNEGKAAPLAPAPTAQPTGPTYDELRAVVVNLVEFLDKQDPTQAFGAVWFNRDSQPIAIAKHFLDNIG